MNFTRAQVYSLLGILCVLAVLWSGHEAVSAMEKKAANKEKETRDIDAASMDFIRIRDQNVEMEKTFGGGEAVVRTAERLAEAEQLTVASVQSVGTEKIGSCIDNLNAIRVNAAPLGPLRRFMNALETSRNGLVIRELTIRKSVSNAARLDAEIIVATLEPAR